MCRSMKTAARSFVALLVTLPCLGLAIAARAQEASRGERPTPDTVDDLGGALQGAFEPEEEELVRPLLPWVRDWMRKLDVPPFLRDTELVFKARTYYFDSFRPDDSRSQAWTIGGALSYRSGWAFRRLRIGTALYTSQPIVAPDGRGGTGLLQEGQSGYTVAGEGWAELRLYEDNTITLYRQEVDLPYVNQADTRMTPNTFEAYLVRGSIPNIPRMGELKLVTGWIQKIRKQSNNSFRDMAEEAGVPGGDAGLATVTLRARPAEGFYFGLTNHLVPDAFNTLYGEGSWVGDITDEWQLRVEGQFTVQWTIGKEELERDPFDTWQLAARIAASWKGIIFTAAGSVTAEDAELLKPYGLSPSYLSLLLSDFDRAGEGALLIGMSYDFERLGVRGLSGFFNLAGGFDATDNRSSDRFADQLEFDLTLDYRFHGRWIEGLWFRARYGFNAVSGAARDAHEVRIIVNFDIPII